LLEAARANGLNAIVAKPLDSLYVPGAWVLVGPESDVESSYPADYYRAVAPVLLPHVQGRGFDSLDALLAAVDEEHVELHVSLALSEDANRPTAMVFGVEAADIALVLRGTFEQLGLQSFAKTTGAGGLQVYVPLNSDVSYDQTRSFARQVAELIEQQMPKVKVDWSQDDTIAPYSLRAGERRTVSAPVTWDEVEAGKLDHDAADVVKRIEKHGDLFAPVLTLVQSVPGMTASASSRA
jgi:bifunctional non-homologous end joining protein LigD